MSLAVPLKVSHSLLIAPARTLGVCLPLRGPTVEAQATESATGFCSHAVSRLFPIVDLFAREARLIKACTCYGMFVVSCLLVYTGLMCYPPIW